MGHREEGRFYPKSNRRPFKGFKWGSGVIPSADLKGSW